MLKAIRLELSQQVANYKKVGSMTARESYPLPPYSTVIGMIHAACDFKEYHDMDVSIQGVYGCDIKDLKIQHSFGIKYEEDRHCAKVEGPDGTYYGITKSPKHNHLLIDVKLVIHILVKNEVDHELILKGLKNPATYLSLGRHEDIVRIDNIKEVILEEIDSNDPGTLAYDMYVPIKNLEETKIGTFYNLNKKYEIINNKREWIEIIEVQHIAAGNMVDLKTGYIDKEIDSLVCFA